MSNRASRACSCRDTGVGGSSLGDNVHFCRVTVRGFLNGSVVGHLRNVGFRDGRSVHRHLGPSARVNVNR